MKIIRMQSWFVVCCALAMSGASIHADQQEVASASREPGVDPYLDSFKALIHALSDHQGAHPTHALSACKQKLAKAKKVPTKELQQVLPDLAAYVDVLRNNTQKQREVELPVVGNMLADLQQTINSLAVQIDNSLIQVDASSTNVDDAALVGLRQLLCALDAKLTTILEEMRLRCDAMQACCAVIGSPHAHSFEVDSVAAIDNQYATVMQWLKTISRQLLMIHGVPWASCTERCWPESW